MTWQLDTLEVPDAPSGHDPPPLNEPPVFDVKLTLPVGWEAVPPLVSLTVTVQVDTWPTTVRAPEHAVDVDVSRSPTDKVVWPLLGACVTSPAYDAVKDSEPAPAGGEYVT